MAKAATDSLTGLLNRESFLEMFAENLRQSFKSVTRVSVLMMDLDKFKLVNDTYGHDHGDHVLRAVKSAAIISRGIGKTVVLGRPTCTVRNIGSGSVTCGAAK